MRVYNVRFGDAILLTVPDEDEHGAAKNLHVLIDIGNALAREGGRDDVFEPIFKDILAILGDEPLDLYIMTHEHMDHVQGLMYGKARLQLSLKAKEVWMTASSAPDYYDRFENAKKQKLTMLALYDDVARFFAARPAAPPPPAIEALLALNNPQASRDCVDHIAAIGPRAPLYIHREAALHGRNPFRRAHVRLLAPEEDTSVYYGRLAPHTLGPLDPETTDVGMAAGELAPPAGVSAADFANLIRFRSHGMSSNLLQIDKAANNTSVVLELEWQGWVLLLPGDAEEKSWEIMERKGLLRPAHFLKVSHHGSINGSPAQLYNKVLPEEAPDGRSRTAVVSTFDGSYPGVPDTATLAALGNRATLYDTRNLPPGGYFDFEFGADGSSASSSNPR
ncbi:hypothetical protein [Bosea sp. (in: a-proteobacteria)]|uniref:hypothetical protein n=1 Tax=Bosea sp. (in: a-proteobacteria) TaxID=1871050 RepID=UPI003564BAE3